MAKFEVLKITNDIMTIRNESKYEDNFTKNILFIDHNEHSKYSLSIYNFIKLFLSDYNNYHIYNIDTKLNEEENKYYINLYYKYIENSNGNHIFADFNNTIIINKELYDESSLHVYINKTLELINLKKDIIENNFNEYFYNINEISNRIMPNVLEYIDDYVNSYVYDVENYDITKDELFDYIRNNKKYIKDYIFKNWKYFNYMLYTSISCFGLAFMNNLLNKELPSYNLYPFITESVLVISLLSIIYSCAIYNLKILEISNLEKVDRFRRKMVRDNDIQDR